MTMIGSRPDEIIAVAQCLLLSHGGFTALSGGMDRHRDLLPILGRVSIPPHSRTRSPTPTPSMLSTRSEWLYQRIGAVLLALSLLPCLRVWPASIGCVAWCTMLTASAALLVVVLQYVPRFARWGIWLAPSAAFALLVFDRF